jgi:sensor c-di-GMP phosphodiesterase-like protein
MHLPLDQLKIDRSFVDEIREDSTSGAIAQTIEISKQCNEPSGDRRERGDRSPA